MPKSPLDASAKRGHSRAGQLGSAELLEDLLCRLGVAVRLEQRGKLTGTPPGVVDRTLPMQGKRLFSPLACLVELAEFGMGSAQVKANHGLVNGRPACARRAVEKA